MAVKIKMKNRLYSRVTICTQEFKHWNINVVCKLENKTLLQEPLGGGASSDKELEELEQSVNSLQLCLDQFEAHLSEL